jgi:hypothetical protein
MSNSTKIDLLKSVVLKLSSKREEFLVEIDILLKSPHVSMSNTDNASGNKTITEKLTDLFLELEKYDTCMKSVNSVLQENIDFSNRVDEIIQEQQRELLKSQEKNEDL